MSAIQIKPPDPSTPAERAKAAKEMSAARALLMAKSPFISTLALSMRLEPSDEIPTAATDGLTIFYNPKWVLQLDRERQICLLAHEALHPALDHVNATRRGARDPRRWNEAGDYVINWMLTQSGFTLIEGGCLDAKYDGMSTEHVYSLLPAKPKGDKGNEGDGPGGIGPDLKEATDPSMQQEVTAQVKRRVAQASQVARQAKEYGNLPESLRRLIDELLNPRIDWRQVMRRFVSERAKDDYTWQRPNKRFDEIMPGLYSETMGHLAIVIDVSGSIGMEQFKIFMSETEAIRQEVRPRQTTIMCCDTAIHNPREFDPQDSILDYKPAGGGGTNMPKAFDWIAKHMPEPPKACIIFTDMYTPFGEDPGYPVLWVSYGNPDAIAPFGETVAMD